METVVPSVTETVKVIERCESIKRGRSGSTNVSFIVACPVSFTGSRPPFPQFMIR